MADRIEYEPREFIASEQAIRGADYALTLKANGAVIKGGITTGPTADKIQIFQWEKKVASQRSASSGLASGRRIHFPMNFIGPMSQAGPLIFKAICNNDVVEGTLDCWAAPGTGERVIIYTVTFSKARIDSYAVLSSPLDGSFCYNFSIVAQAITETFTDGGIEHHDEWSGQSA